MTISLSTMSTDQLMYLKQKWSSEMRELDLDRTRASERLESRLERRSSNAEEMAVVSANLTQAQNMLTHLETSSAPATLVTSQEALVANLQKSYDEQSRGAGVLTDEEAMLQQVVIDELELRKTYRETKISEVDALLNP